MLCVPLLFLERVTFPYVWPTRKDNPLRCTKHVIPSCGIRKHPLPPFLPANTRLHADPCRNHHSHPAFPPTLPDYYPTHISHVSSLPISIRQGLQIHTARGTRCRRGPPWASRCVLPSSPHSLRSPQKCPLERHDVGLNFTPCKTMSVNMLITQAVFRRGQSPGSSSSRQYRRLRSCHLRRSRATK